MSFSPAIRFNYGWNSARCDLAAGATVAAIAVPQAMAYALIAGVDPRFGLYAAIVTAIVASILGSSNHLINGPTNAISLTVLSALVPFSGQLNAFEAMFLLGAIVGLIQICIAVFKLGDLTRYVSESVILGFMFGAGLLIAIGQIANFAGEKLKGTEDQSILMRTWLTLSQSKVNPEAVMVGLLAIAAVLGIRKLVDRFDLPRVDMLAGLLIASFAAAALGWSTAPLGAKPIVAVIGAVPAALPSFHVPVVEPGWFGKLGSGALAVALLGLLEALSVAKSLATLTHQKLDYNRQCLAEGVGNLVGGFFQAMPGSGSLTRSAINYQSGAVSRLSGVYSGVIVAIVVVTLGPYARFIPKPALAGLLFIAAARLIDWERLANAIRASRFEAALVAATAFTAIFISVADSILVGMVLSLLLFVPRASKTGIRELIVTPDFFIRERLPGERRAGWLLIYDLEGELFFGSAPEMQRHLDGALSEIDVTGIKYVVLRLRRSSNPDIAAVEQLERFLREAERRGVTVLLAGVRPDLLSILENVQLESRFPEDRIFPQEGRLFSATLRAVHHAAALARAGGVETGFAAVEPVPADPGKPSSTPA